VFHPVAQKLTVDLAGPNGGRATFQQLIDHSNPSLGTFPQRYWWNTTYWKGPGSPVCRAHRYRYLGGYVANSHQGGSFHPWRG
jgi:hypothetical protein